jgi:carboxypeptidase PM20D1
MGFKKKLAVAAAAVAVVGAGTVGVRTATYGVAAVDNGASIKLATIPAIDVTAAASRLGAAVRFQTVSNQNQADNRLDEWTKLQSWLVTSYPNVHRVMQREVIAGGTLVYHWTGSDPDAQPIIMMAHQDVVPVTPGTEKDWKYPPFDGVIAEEAVWGRGTVDDKGSLIGLFEAFEALAASGFSPKRSIYLVSAHDEEVFGGGAEAAAKLLGDRKVRALFTLDEGSAIILDAPVVNGPAILIGVAEKGYGTLKVTANAAGGHSSMPPDETGVVNLAKAVLAINASPFPIELKGPGADMLAVLGERAGGMTKVAVANQWLFGPLLRQQVAATPSGAAAFHTTIAPTMLEGSPKENVLPQSANALINYRFAPWDRSTQVMARAKAATRGMPVELAWVNPPREPSKVSSTTSKGWKLVAAAAQPHSPDAPISPYLVVGGTDSRNFENISDDVYRFMPMQFTIKSAAMIHGTNEHMTIANLKRMIEFYAQLVATSAG